MQVVINDAGQSSHAPIDLLLRLERAVERASEAWPLGLATLCQLLPAGVVYGLVVADEHQQLSNALDRSPRTRSLLRRSRLTDWSALVSDAVARGAVRRRVPRMLPAEALPAHWLRRAGRCSDPSRHPLQADEIASIVVGTPSRWLERKRAECLVTMTRLPRWSRCLALEVDPALSGPDHLGERD